MPDFAPLPLPPDPTANCDLWFGDHHVGTFKVRFTDTASPKYQLCLARVRRRMSRADAKRVDSPNDESDVNLAHRLEVEVLVDSGAVVDWQMKDANGQDIPFSNSALTDFLNEPSYRWALAQLRSFSFDAANFTGGGREQVTGE